MPWRACLHAIHDLAAEVDHEFTAGAELVLRWELGRSPNRGGAQVCFSVLSATVILFI
jgi:hypothetical protein